MRTRARSRGRRCSACPESLSPQCRSPLASCLRKQCLPYRRAVWLARSQKCSIDLHLASYCMRRPLCAAVMYGFACVCTLVGVIAPIIQKPAITAITDGLLTSYYSNSVAITAITRSDEGNSDSNSISRAIIATTKQILRAAHSRSPPNGGCCNAYATPAGAHSPERGLRAQPRRRAGNERGLDGADEGGAGDGGVDESASEGGASEGSADECSAEQDGAGEEGAGEGGAGAVTLDREQDKC